MFPFLPLAFFFFFGADGVSEIDEVGWISKDNGVVGWFAPEPEGDGVFYRKSQSDNPYC